MYLCACAVHGVIIRLKLCVRCARKSRHIIYLYIVIISDKRGTYMESISFCTTMYIYTVRRSSPRRHHRRDVDRQSLRGCIRFRSPSRWRFAICLCHVCCTAYLQPLAHRRRPDVPSTGTRKGFPIIISPVYHSPVVIVAHYLPRLAVTLEREIVARNIIDILKRHRFTYILLFLFSILNRLSHCKSV